MLLKTALLELFVEVTHLVVGLVLVVMTLHFWVLDARSSRCFRNASLRVLLH